MSIGDVGCEDSGPPPGVGGLARECTDLGVVGDARGEAFGDGGGETGGAGMLVPAVRLKSMGPMRGSSYLLLDIVGAAIAAAGNELQWPVVGREVVWG
ncbi:hypothetical protein LTR16_005910, partial [Cryomyces antarcticus]